MSQQVKVYRLMELLSGADIHAYTDMRVTKKLDFEGSTGALTHTGTLTNVGDLSHDGVFATKRTQSALTNTAIVTAAQLLGKVLDGTPTAAATYTLPTAALLVAAMTNPAVGASFIFVVNNKSTTAGAVITVAAGTGGTADGTVTVDLGVIRAFLVIVTNVTAGAEAYFVYGIGA